MGIHQEDKECLYEARGQLKDEVVEYKQLLTELKIKANDLASCCPKNPDTRQEAIKVAKLISENRCLSTYIKKKKKPPLKELKRFPIEYHKTIKKYKKYIIALSIIYIKEFNHIKRYISL
ncbi:RNA polymerase sigma factor [Salinibacillus kushneri]|uniref:RNA polymerase sigma factor n=1 Tax=Salinibacillus kushneri TaxID=237682 RepID=A0A1I0CBI6_9BACI|nr:hypothetical protein [Salinibacillus kushneri]SET16638.1 RNA polymerase sigma factor [Salinibacillus kushneri]